METFDVFGNISGYKLNKNKWESLTIERQLSQTLKDCYNFKWDTKKIKYLSINISENREDLYDNNYGALVTIR